MASGFDPKNVAATDTGALLDALGLAATPANLDSVSPWRFVAPLSPDMAAAREQRVIPFDEFLEFCRTPRPSDVTLIEGIGGVMVPLDDTHTVLDWIVELGAPVLLVAGSYLGTLSHTLTAVAALRARGVRTRGDRRERIRGAARIARRDRADHSTVRRAGRGCRAVAAIRCDKMLPLLAPLFQAA